MKDIEFSGLWWLPTKPENKVAGILVFTNQEGIRLRLIGSFDGLRGLLPNADPLRPIILGLTVDGKLLTLHGCRPAGSRMSFPGFVSKQYRVYIAFIGGHVESEEHLKFYKAGIQYSRLPDWVQVSGLTALKSDDEPFKLELRYDLPQELRADTPDATVSLDYTFNTTGNPLDEVRLKQTVWIYVEPNTDVTFDELNKGYIKPLQNLLSLATTKPNSIVDIYAHTRHNTRQTSGGNPIEVPLQVIFQQYYVEPELDERLIPDNMLFTLHDVSRDFSRVIGRWLDTSQALNDVCGLYFGIQYIPRLYLEQKFLSTVQAIETYHRRRMLNHVLPEEEHDKRVADILSTSPREHREWLEARLEYSNEPRLRQRIKELFDKTKEVVAPLVKKKSGFVDKVVNTRNYLTHYDPSLKDKAAQGGDLYLITEVLSYMLQACFLSELGLPPLKWVELFSRNQAYIFAMNRENKA